MNSSQKQLLIHISLFVITLFTTTFAGVEWMYSKYLFWVDDEFLMTWNDFVRGLEFSLPFLAILTFHEFGHYFTARYHHIKVTLPYYIPFWLGFILIPSFGTMGAMIRIKEHIYSLKHYFDVGISGPLAGFVIALGVIWYGFANLPEPEYIFQIHPEYEQFGNDYAEHVYNYEFRREIDSLNYIKRRKADSLAVITNPEKEWQGYPEFKPREEYSAGYFSKPLLFVLVEKFVVSSDDQYKIPSDQEIMHYPFLMAGLLALLFTGLNLFPIGQLDGGHILFGMVGPRRHEIISKVIYTLLLFYAGLGVVTIHSFMVWEIESMSWLSFWMIMYLYLLYKCAQSLFNEDINRWLYATVIFALQFLLNYLFGIQGYWGWLLFAFILGRYLGVIHPPVVDQRPLSLGRHLLGWIALIVFILSFSPKPMIL